MKAHLACDEEQRGTQFAGRDSTVSEKVSLAA